MLWQRCSISRALLVLINFDFVKVGEELPLAIKIIPSTIFTLHFLYITIFPSSYLNIL